MNLIRKILCSACAQNSDSPLQHSSRFRIVGQLNEIFQIDVVYIKAIAEETYLIFRSFDARSEYIVFIR